MKVSGGEILGLDYWAKSCGCTDLNIISSSFPVFPSRLYNIYKYTLFRGKHCEFVKETWLTMFNSFLKLSVICHLSFALLDQPWVEG